MEIGERAKVGALTGVFLITLLALTGARSSFCNEDKVYMVYALKLNASCLPKRPRQTGQTQIRLLLKKQSDQGLPCLLF